VNNQLAKVHPRRITLDTYEEWLEQHDTEVFLKLRED